MCVYVFALRCVSVKGFSSCYLIVICYQFVQYKREEKHTSCGKGAQPGDVNDQRTRKLNLGRELRRTHHIQPGSKKARGCEVPRAICPRAWNREVRLSFGPDERIRPSEPLMDIFHLIGDFRNEDMGQSKKSDDYNTSTGDWTSWPWSPRQC